MQVGGWGVDWSLYKKWQLPYQLRSRVVDVDRHQLCVYFLKNSLGNIGRGRHTQQPWQVSPCDSGRTIFLCIASKFASFIWTKYLTFRRQREKESQVCEYAITLFCSCLLRNVVERCERWCLLSLQKTLFNFPISVFFIVVNEFCERFSYYGMRSELVSDELLNFVQTDLCVHVHNTSTQSEERDICCDFLSVSWKVPFKEDSTYELWPSFFTVYP